MKRSHDVATCHDRVCHAIETLADFSLKCRARIDIGPLKIECLKAIDRVQIVALG